MFISRYSFVQTNDFEENGKQKNVQTMTGKMAEMESARHWHLGEGRCDSQEGKVAVEMERVEKKSGIIPTDHAMPWDKKKNKVCVSNFVIHTFCDHSACSRCLSSFIAARARSNSQMRS